MKTVCFDRFTLLISIIVVAVVPQWLFLLTNDGRQIHMPEKSKQSQACYLFLTRINKASKSVEKPAELDQHCYYADCEFLTVPRVGMRSVLVAFPGYIHSLTLKSPVKFICNSRLFMSSAYIC